MMICFVLVFGLLIGSFLNVCIYRIPREEEIVYTPSHCMNCGDRIKWYDLIPVFSFLLLRGHCRNCKQKLSLQYPLVEVLNGILYVWIYMVHGLSIETLIYALLASILLIVSFIDYSHYIIPNGLVIALFVLALVNLGLNLNHWLYYVIGFFAASVCLLILALITKGKMGGGDIKLMAAAGLLIGWDQILLALMIGSIIGSVVGISLMVFRIIRRDQMIPFGPFLSMGILIAGLYGKELINWYINLIG